MGWTRKLTDAQAADIRRRYAAGLDSHRSLAAAFGISHGTVQRILAQATYRSAADADAAVPTRSHSRGWRRRKLSGADAAAIRRRFTTGETYRALGDAYGVSSSVIFKLVNGQTYREAT
jgi:DNA invertase Pin-like site-specific DNA recombinase